MKILAVSENGISNEREGEFPMIQPFYQSVFPAFSSVNQNVVDHLLGALLGLRVDPSQRKGLVRIQVDG